MKISGIYRILNAATDKVYIGSSVDVKRRFTDHKLALRHKTHHSVHLQRAWDKYGEDSFLFEVVEECSKEILIDREKWWIENLLAGDREYGYNIMDVKDERFILSADTAKVRNEKSTKIYVWSYPDIKHLFTATIRDTGSQLNIPKTKIEDILYQIAYNPLRPDARRRSYKGYTFTFDETPPAIKTTSSTRTGKARGPYSSWRGRTKEETKLIRKTKRQAKAALQKIR